MFNDEELEKYFNGELEVNPYPLGTDLWWEWVAGVID